MSSDTSFDPIAALGALGLPNYEAKVFVALQKLGTGTAKQVSDIADVPQSQVYGTTEALKERGLIEIQHGTPKTYRPVPLSEARERLEDRFEAKSQQAFSFLEQVKDEHAEADEQQEGVWRLNGTAAIESRTEELIQSATNRVVIGVNEDVSFSPSVLDRLKERAAAGIRVVMLTANPAEVPDIGDVEVTVIPPKIQGSDQAGRLLLVDDDTVLLSVVEADGTETAIWSARSGFARVLLPLVEDATLADRPEPA